MAAEPSIGRAVRVEGAPAPEADLTCALYEQYANQIFRYCLHQLGSREEAEDAVQSTFLNAFRGIKRGVVPELESAWLFKIAHNVCLSRRRTSWRRGRIESPTDFHVVEDLTPAPSRRADELIGLQDVLEEMPESQRRAILLREWQGLSYREIAEELELSQAAVETLIFRARRSLAAGLEQPPEHKRRVVRRADIGNVLVGLKSLLLGGGAAVKVAATVAVVSASTVIAAAPVEQHRAHVHAAPKPAAAAPASHASATPSRPAASVAGPADASEPVAPAPAAPASERAAVPPADTGHAEPQHAPAASAPTTAPTHRTTSEKSKTVTPSGRSRDAKKDAAAGQARTPRAGRASSSGGSSARQRVTSGVRGGGGSNGRSDSKGQIGSSGQSDSSTTGVSPPAPVVAPPATSTGTNRVNGGH